MWCSAAAPLLHSQHSKPSAPPMTPFILPPGRVDFVYGTSDSICLVLSESNRNARCVQVVGGMVSDVFAVEWLSSTHFVAGQRNGIISLYRLNVRGRFAQSQRVVRLGVWRHPQCIVEIARVNERRIVATGLDSEVYHPVFFRFCSCQADSFHEPQRCTCTTSEIFTQ